VKFSFDACETMSKGSFDLKWLIRKVPASKIKDALERKK
jgi:hypothetical protein